VILKEGWWRYTYVLDGEIDTRLEDRIYLRIGFHHRSEWNHNLAIGDRTLEIYSRNTGANDQKFIDRFADAFSTTKRELRTSCRLLPISPGTNGT
jgi:Mg-chelatase subunit ChlI